MEDKKFDPQLRDKLNNPERLVKLDPEKIWAFVDYKNPLQIFDIGAGTGYITQALSEKVPHARFEALDIEPIMVEEMKKMFSGNSNIRPHLMERNQIEAPDDFADVVLMINLFHELNKPYKLLREIKRVLKPGGKLLIIDWAKKPEACESGPPLDHRIDEATITSLMIEADFSNILTTEDFTDHLGVIGTKI
ncbi:class I SAM-dependent methyltransferase [Marinilabilia sp.]